MSGAMSDLEFRTAVVDLLGQIAEDLNEILEHIRWNRENDGWGPAGPSPVRMPKQAPCVPLIRLVYRRVCSDESAHIRQSNSVRRRAASSRRAWLRVFRLLVSG